MEIIPVIDLLDGQVVRAQRGERARYRPIDSALCRSSNPLEVAHGLLGLYPFKTLYIADLDAIQKRGSHISTITVLRKTYPDIDLWVDAGFSNLADCHPWKETNITYVVGSESLGNIEEWQCMRNALDDNRLVLSLDWRDEQPLGLTALFASAKEWPQRLIIMSLGRVGSYAGPDLEKLKKMHHCAGINTIYAAGGVRNIRDLQALKTLGVAGSLVASALHDNAISTTDLTSLPT